MKNLIRAGLVALVAATMACPAFGTERDPAVRRAFQNSHPCPSTGKKTGACPGYVVDHIKALCVGGPDTVANMQWQTTAESKKKDRVECRAKKHRG